MTDIPYDVEVLRLERLARLQSAMRRYGVDVCVLSTEPNVRYSTGVTAMPVYSMSTFVRCAVVPQEGTPILFEHANSMHRSALRTPDVRPMHAWEFYDDPQAEAGRWAKEMAGGRYQTRDVLPASPTYRLGHAGRERARRPPMPGRPSAPANRRNRGRHPSRTSRSRSTSRAGRRWTGSRTGSVRPRREDDRRRETPVVAIGGPAPLRLGK